MKILILILGVVFSAENLCAEETAETAVLPIQEVQRAALDYARIRPDDLSEMKRKSRLAAALPKLQVGAKKVFDEDMDVTVNDNVSVTSGGINIGPETTNMQQNLNNQTSIEVKAVWSLDSLVYNQDLLAITEEARYQMKERRLLLAEVNKLYFEWLRLRGDSPNIRLDEVVADLDALTGGWFSNKTK